MHPPIFSLPPEIIGEIFSHYVKGPVDIRLTKDDGPLVLRAVCRHWKEICSSTCSLWASMVIDDMHSWANKDHLRFLQFWLSHVGNHPLDLFTFVDMFTKTSPVFTALLRYSSQWRILELSFDGSCSDFPQELIHGRVPSLTILAICLEDDSSTFLTAFREAPSLREVTLTGRLRYISLPWIQLTHLTMGPDCNPEECMEILNQTPNLEALDIDADMALHWPWAPSLPLTLTSLHTFKATSVYDGLLLDHFILPAVRTIKLSGLESTGVSRLLALGARSAWPLQSIRLSKTDNTVSNICLRGLPSLEEVEIVGPAFGNKTTDCCKLLKLLASDGGFLPAVRAMTIGYCTAQMSSSALAETLASRWHGKREGIARMRSFHLCFARHANISVRAIDNLRTGLRPLTEEGLDAVIATDCAH